MVPVKHCCDGVYKTHISQVNAEPAHTQPSHGRGDGDAFMFPLSDRTIIFLSHSEIWTGICKMSTLYSLSPTSAETEGNLGLPALNVLIKCIQLFMWKFTGAQTCSEDLFNKSDEDTNNQVTHLQTGIRLFLLWRPTQRHRRTVNSWFMNGTFGNVNISVSAIAMLFLWRQKWLYVLC